MIEKELLSRVSHTRKSFKDIDFNIHMIRHIRSYLPTEYRDIVVICIGTDRCTGDALGPLTGTYLSKYSLQNISVYGTIHNPVHARNLTETLDTIYSTYENPFLIAIDASLGKPTSVGYVLSGIGSLEPGTALKKDLPNVGDMYIAGIVNISGFMEFQILQSTRLSIVIDMAQAIAKLLFLMDQLLDVRETSSQ
ncbi:MAG TPA: spore protease YyaC [Bacillota bacterium]|nr:spore protease YyaC [Bacillota bacterium]